MKKQVFFGQTPLDQEIKKVEGELVERNGEHYYRISHFDRMPPFFMTIVSDSDHWMFVSSRGGLTCGRKDPGYALFPYYTDDKIHDGSVTTGPLSVLLIEKGDRTFLWEPFAAEGPEVYSTRKNLYKSSAGNTLLFEAVNHTLQVTCSYSWQNSQKYGFVKETVVTNDGPETIRIRMIDGIRNILPYGVNRSMQSNMSTLVDGYKRCEIHEPTGTGIYTMSSIPTDKAEPSEALKATTVWSAGTSSPVYLLSEDQLPAFRLGSAPVAEKELKGRRGNYLVYEEYPLDPGGNKQLMLVADVDQGPSEVASLIRAMGSKELADQVKEDVRAGTRRLTGLVGKADGIQHTGDRMKSMRHYSNALFNIMRGGIFPYGYRVPLRDLADFLKERNSEVFGRNHRWLSSEDNGFMGYSELLDLAGQSGDADFLRLVYEYLPLTFSRRHGDPSRPWNAFSIDVRKENGEWSLNYQGNWRDIFQNWEALALSFPAFIESFAIKFLNASTRDGYNPYRITRNGIDWEVLDPSDPWSNIGYWGDHQVIYLVKLLELSLNYHPGELVKLLDKELFTYANVPYRIMDYEAIVAHPRDTILFDEELAAIIDQRVAELGSDGKLVVQGKQIFRVNLAEKLLVPLLSKLTNLIPEGGIWMNTQRPEWNDANNALVGNGLSMVTLYYLRRYVEVVTKIFRGAQDHLQVSGSVADHFGEVSGILNRYRDQLKTGFSDSGRREFADAMGAAGTTYRASVYVQEAETRRGALKKNELTEFLQRCLEYFDQSIAANRRPDGLYHAYNLVHFGEGSCSIGHLQEMLEGQVAVISSGFLGPAEVLELLDALRQSAMYRSDQRSYTLYPDKQLPPFLEKNLPDPALLKRSDFLSREVRNGNRRIIEQDEEGKLHFNGRFRNVDELTESLDAIEGLYDKEKGVICDAFLETFRHRQFTGRSGTFFKYEGLGSIYWHMVSKLLLAAQEAYLDGFRKGEKETVLRPLKAHLESIEEGIGASKPPREYGAFPMDPYSHTPGFSGVQQPGMTGQVKEDILSRFGELGIGVVDGRLSFDPVLLSQDEFLQENEEWSPGDERIGLEAGELGFTLCGIPVIYHIGEKREILVEYRDGKRERVEGSTLPSEVSSIVFSRSPALSRIRVQFPPGRNS